MLFSSSSICHFSHTTTFCCPCMIQRGHGIINTCSSDFPVCCATKAISDIVLDFQMDSQSHDDYTISNIIQQSWDDRTISTHLMMCSLFLGSL